MSDHEDELNFEEYQKYIDELINEHNELKTSPVMTERSTLTLDGMIRNYITKNKPLVAILTPCYGSVVLCAFID